MKVSELIKLLNGCNPDDLVVLSSDGEGNTYAPVSGADLSRAYRDDGSGGTTKLRKLTPELIKRGYGEEDAVQDGDGSAPCCILYPS
jgi:hypothetical protein